MSPSLLENLRSIPDHRRAEGKRFDLATVLLYAILGMVAGANSYRQMHEFIRVHRRRLNEAFGLALRYAPSYTGLRDILQGVDPSALETAFRAHAFSITPAAAPTGMVAIAVDGKTLRGSFDAFADKKAAHMLSALRHSDQIVLGHLMVGEKSNEIPTAPELIEALRLKGCVFTLDAADSDEAGHAFQYEAGRPFRSEAGQRSDLMSATDCLLSQIEVDGVSDVVGGQVSADFKRADVAFAGCPRPDRYDRRCG